VLTRMLDNGVSNRASSFQRAAEMLKAKNVNGVGRAIPNFLHYAYQCMRPIADRTFRDLPLVGRVYRRSVFGVRRGF